MSHPPTLCLVIKKKKSKHQKECFNELVTSNNDFSSPFTGFPSAYSTRRESLYLTHPMFFNPQAFKQESFLISFSCACSICNS